MRWPVGLGAVAAAAALAGCGGGDEASGPLTVYSGREEELVAPLFEQFTDETGIEVEVRYGDSAELAATIGEEGGNSPADVFFGQDPGSLGAVDAQLEELPENVLERVEARFRDADGRWVGTSGRTRVLVYSTEAVPEDELAGRTVTRPSWRRTATRSPSATSSFDGRWETTSIPSRSTR